MGQWLIKKHEAKIGVSLSDMLGAADWARLCIYLLLLAGMYFSTFDWLVLRDWVREDYNYAYLVPFIVLYLIWEKRNELSSISSSPSWVGIIPLAIGLCLFWLGELSGEFFALYFSSWLLTVALCWVHMGWEKLKAILFPLIIALTMFPLPNFLNVKVTSKLQLISSQLGVLFIQAYGMTAYREGNVIDLGFTQLQVVEACSGLRYVIPLFVLGLLMAYLFRSALWKRAFLVFSTIPLSIFINSFRIGLTGILYKHLGAKAAEGFFHGFSGWLIFIFVIPVLLFEMWVLKKLPPRENAPKRGGVSGENTGSLHSLQSATGRSNSLKALWSPFFVVPALLLAVTLALSHGIEFREKIPLKQPLSRFPLKVGEWSGKNQFMEKKFIDELDLTDYAIVDYQSASGKFVNFYVAYYESQRKGESIHSPETCLPGSGWIFTDAGTRNIPMASQDMGKMTVNRAYMEKSGYKELAYYWFPQRGRVLTNAWQLKIYTFWDSLTRQRTDGALVRLITPVGQNEKVEDADQRLSKFAQEIVPILNQFIPGKSG